MSSPRRFKGRDAQSDDKSNVPGPGPDGIIVVMDPGKAFNCQDCGMGFSKKQSLFGHLKVHKKAPGHGDGGEQEKCPVCGTGGFKGQEEMKKHQRMHQSRKPWKCKICSFGFEKESQLRYHIERRHDSSEKRRYPCEICSKSFFSRGDLSQHETVHRGAKDHICDVCGRGFSHVSNLNRHKPTHSEVRERPYACIQCGKRFVQISGLRKHVQNIHGEGLVKRLACVEKECGASLLSRETLGKHLRSKHKYTKEQVVKKLSSLDINRRKNSETLTRRQYCKVCGDTFSDRWELKTHIDAHQSQGTFCCKLCGINFSSVKDLQTHKCSGRGEKKLPNRTRKGPSVKKSLPPPKSTTAADCDILICFENEIDPGGGIVVPENLRVLGEDGTSSNILILSEEDAKRIKDGSSSSGTEGVIAIEIDSSIPNTVHRDLPTPLATKKSAAKRLKRKQSSKTKKKVTDFRCMDCSKVFTRIGDFKQHVAMHDVKSRVSCKFCNMKFAWKTSLKRHMDSVHLRGNKKVNDCKCDQCNKIFSSGHLLKVHKRRIHLKERNFKCQECQKSFFKSHDLVVHSRVHTKEKSYHCHDCGKRFGHSSHLSRHSRAVHLGIRAFPCSGCNKRLSTNAALKSHTRRYHSKLDEK